MYIRQQDEMRESMLSQILLPVARERLARIAIVKPEKVRSVEDLLVQMAQGGQLKGQVGEAQLIDFLEKVGAQEDSSRSKVKIRRKVPVFDDQEEDDDDDDDF